MSVQTAKTELYDLIEGLNDEQVPAAKEHVEFLLSGHTDKLLWVLDTAPLDDEPTTPEGGAGAEAALQEYRRGETISAEEAKRLLLPSASLGDTS